MKANLAIHDWGDGYVALKHRAEDVRGEVALDLGDGQWERWPRTTGDDALLVAAFLDPHVRQLGASRMRSVAVVERWRSLVEDLARWTTQHPDQEYLENRRFWAQVLTVCVLLSSEFAPLPSQDAWDTLLLQIGDLPRNGAPSTAPFGPFEGVGSYDELYLAQLTKLLVLRGMDRRDPEPGMTGMTRSIPRTTNADVKALRDFWSKALGSVKKVIGHEGVAKKWAAISAEVDAQTRGADANAVYPKNNGFWRALASVSTQVAVADQSPSKGAQILESIKHGVTQAPEVIASGAKAVVSEVAEVTSDVAGGVGKVAGSALRGLVSGSALPWLVGGGVIGTLLLFRGRRSAPAAGEA